MSFCLPLLNSVLERFGLCFHVDFIALLEVEDGTVLNAHAGNPAAQVVALIIEESQMWTQAGAKLLGWLAARVAG
jgi:hypothetical protein